jgi:hypothetical protein
MKLKLLALACVGGIIQPAPAQTTAPAGSGARIVFAATDYDFGKVDSGTLVQHDYVFTNTGNLVLEISDVRPSCGCTTAGNWDKRVEPGGTGKIPIQFNSGGYAGQIHKSVSVACNDPAQPGVTLTLQAIIGKSFDISPQYAVFNLPPDGQSNQTRVIRIINNSDRAVTVSDPTCASPAFKMELQTVREGKEFELRVTAIASNVTGSVSAPVTLKTSSEKMPSLSLVAVAMIQPWFSLKPLQIMLPATPLSQAMEFPVMIQNNGTHSVVLSEPRVNAGGAAVQLTEMESGRQFKLALVLPAGFQSQAGVQVTVKSSNPRFPLLTIPVNQPLSAP